MKENGASVQTKEKRPTVAVVVGSGGIKTFAAIAMYELLDELGVVPDLLIGCSGGAIMTAMRATGRSPAEMYKLIPELLSRDLFSKIDYRVLLGIPKLPFGRYDFSCGIIKPDGIQAIHRRLFGDKRLEELNPPTLLQVTDYHTGQGFVLERGSLADAVYASGASYPALPPTQIDGRWLVDGGFSSPCPVLEAVKRGIDIIIAVSIETKLDVEPKSYMDMFNYGQSLCANNLIRNQMATAINLHHYEIIQANMRFGSPIEFWDIDKVPFILEVGKKVARAKKDEILSAIQNFDALQRSAQG
jgi:NTE family protein